MGESFWRQTVPKTSKFHLIILVRRSLLQERSDKLMELKGQR